MSGTQPSIPSETSPLTLHLHPLASYCHKVLIAFYENGTPFVPHRVDLGDADSRAAFLALWPIGKMPVLHDAARGETVPESTIIVEYLARHYPGAFRPLPDDPDTALRVRLLDRFFDLYIQEPMQKIVGDRLRPADGRDPVGVGEAEARLATAYRVLDARLAEDGWAAGEAFTLADCAAAPALFYACRLVPFADGQRRLAAYHDRLMARPSVARVIEEAKPWFHLFPA